jgi:hypothetical protein
MGGSAPDACRGLGIDRRQRSRRRLDVARVLDDAPPLLGVVGRVRLELELGGGGECAADFAAGDILALDVELDSVNGADDAVWQVQSQVRRGILGEIVRVLEGVQVFGRRDHVVAGTEALDDGTGLALQRSLDGGLGGRVVLVGEGDVVEGPGRLVRVDEDAVVALDEARPFVVAGDLLRAAGDVAVQGAVVVQLGAHELEVGVHGELHGLDDVRLELGEGVLDDDGVLAAVVFFDDLLVQAVVDAAAQHIRVVLRLDFIAGQGSVHSGILAERFNVLLGQGARLVDCFGAFDGARLEFLGLVLDLFVQAVENGEHLAFEVLFRFVVHVGHALNSQRHSIPHPERHSIPLCCCATFRTCPSRHPRPGRSGGPL